MANDFEYLLMCLLVICISLEKALQIPYPLGCLFIVEWLEFFVYFGYKTLISYMIYKHSLIL